MIQTQTKMLGDKMSEQTVYPVSEEQREKTLLTKEQYEVMYLLIKKIYIFVGLKMAFLMSVKTVLIVI
jgi:hypothetical protein